MAMPTQGMTEFFDFPGLILNAGVAVLPPGAGAEQINLACVVIGEMRVRGGIKEVTFENLDTQSS